MYRITPTTEIVPPHLRSSGNQEWDSKHPDGLTDNVKDQIETPDDVLRRLLFEGEQVVQQFDCYFPGFMLPKWKIALLIVQTLGLYLFVLAYRALQRCCYRNRCCMPNLVELARGKLAITNYGRVLCWSLNGVQQKIKRSCCFRICQCCCPQLCAPPSAYAFKSQTRVYSAANIRQMTYFYESSAGCFSCCLSYETGISLSFDQFNHDLPSNGMYGVTTRQKNSYTSAMRCLLNNILTGAQTVRDFAEGSLNLTSNEHVVHIISGTEDVYFNGDVHRVTQTLTNLNNAVIASLAYNIPDVFVASPSTMGSKFSLTDDLTGVKLVEDGTGNITIPKQWFSFIEGEEVVTAYGQLYKMSCFDWFLAIVTLGYHYCWNVRRKKYARSALIVTTKRIVEIQIFQKFGKIPANLNDVFFTVNTLLPGSVKSGYIKSIGKGERYKNLEAGILTSGGAIQFQFWDGVQALPFAKVISSPNSRVKAGTGIVWPADMSGITIDKTDLNLFPLLPGEIVRAKISSNGVIWEPFCGGKIFVTPWNYLRRFFSVGAVSKVCSQESLGFCWHILPYFLSCALRPFQTTNHLVVTDTMIISYSTSRNYGLCGFRECGCTPGKPFTTIGDYVVVWAPITDMMGYNVDIDVSGRENCVRRCCKMNLFGKIFCPISDSSYLIGADMGDYQMLVGGQEKNHNWSKDAGLSESLRMLGKLGAMIQNKQQAPVAMPATMLVAMPVVMPAPIQRV